MRRTIEIKVTDERGELQYGHTVDVELRFEAGKWVAEGDGRVAQHSDSLMAVIQIASPEEVLSE